MTSATRITIITATLNARVALEHTARSVLGQSWPDLQWIVADGGSTDGTVDWLAEHFARHPSWLWFSQADRGIYHALNRTLAHVRGDWVLCLGSGDTLLDADVLRRCVERLDALAPTVSIAYGGVLFTPSLEALEGRLYYPRWQGVDGPWIAARPAVPGTQGIFHRANLLQDGFAFDTRLRIAADSEPVLNELLAGHGADLDLVVSRMPQGGLSTNPRNRLYLLLEFVRINYRLGIFWRRPGLQLLVLSHGLVMHLLRLAGWQNARKLRAPLSPTHPGRD